MGHSLLFWYRQTYQIPRHDPRLDDLTWEELELEYLAWQAFHHPVDPEDAISDAWLEAVAAGTVDTTDPDAPARFRAEWLAQQAQAPSLDETWDVLVQGGEG